MNEKKLENLLKDKEFYLLYHIRFVGEIYVQKEIQEDIEEVKKVIIPILKTPGLVVVFLFVFFFRESFDLRETITKLFSK